MRDLMECANQAPRIADLDEASPSPHLNHNQAQFVNLVNIKHVLNKMKSNKAPSDALLKHRLMRIYLKPIDELLGRARELENGLPGKSQLRHPA
jgi:hypothetical protein